MAGCEKHPVLLSPRQTPIDEYDERQEQEVDWGVEQQESIIKDYGEETQTGTGRPPSRDFVGSYKKGPAPFRRFVVSMKKGLAPPIDWSRCWVEAV